MSAYGPYRTSDGVEECPLLGVKRTSKFKSVTSACDAKQTSRQRRGAARDGPRWPQAALPAGTLTELRNAMMSAMD